MTQKSEQTRCGYVALVGAPNAGKSTLLNQMVGSKVAIVTPKVQTTRNRILGICIEEQTQLIFVDTPGVFNAKKKFEKAMVRSALEGARDADLVVLMVDAYKGICEDTERLLEEMKSMDTSRKLLVLNKIDKVRKDKLPALVESIYAISEFAECFMVSALKGDRVEDIRSYTAKHMPESPWLYPEDQMTDVPLRMLASEITREKLFMRLQKELPYSIAVETEQWEDKTDGSVKVSQVIYVRSEGQKIIVVGSGGEMLKTVGKSAREEMTRVFGFKVHLFLFVKVTENWKNTKEFYDTIGLDYK